MGVSQLAGSGAKDDWLGSLKHPMLGYLFLLLWRLAYCAINMNRQYRALVSQIERYSACGLHLV